MEADVARADSAHDDALRFLLLDRDARRAKLTRDKLCPLASSRFSLTHVTTLDEALDRLAASTLDAVLVEQSDALYADTLSRLRDRRTDTPIFVLADSPDNVAWDALGAGATDVVVRGDPPDELFAARLRSAVERRHERRSRQLEELVEIYPDAVLVVNLRGTVRFVNQAAVVLFNRAREELLGESLGFSIADGNTSEIMVLRKGGDRVAEIRVSKLTWHDEVAFLAICRDVTESKRVTMQLQVADRMASLGTLAAGVAHEINNPLAAVLANLALVREQLEAISSSTKIETDVFEELAEAMVAGERVRRIVRDLKVLSRVEDDARGPVDLERVLDWTLRMAENETRHRARTVREYHSIPLVLANEARLAQVFLNLVVNAAQSIPEGNADGNEIRVTIELDPRGRVLVAISDTGPGMSPEVQARLFTPFFTTKPVGDGTGLGLAICHRIVEGLGGEITFESRLGIGTTFRVALPVAPVADASLAATTQPIPTAKRRGRILVIDDEVSVAKIVQRVLSRDHDVVTEQSGARALSRLLDGERYDVILCDLMMPEMTGMELHDALALKLPEDAARMVFMTGGAFTPRSRAFLDCMPNQRVDKPFDAAGLRALVNILVR